MAKRFDFKWQRQTTGATTLFGVVVVAYLLILGMVVCSVILAVSVPDDATVSAAGVGLAAFALFAAGSAAGSGLGFLFGLPRSRLVDTVGGGEQATPSPTPQTDPDPHAGARYLTNSNLIKVSDWLTTIIVGVGLVNLGKIGPAVGDLSAALEEPLGGSPYSGLVGVSALIVAAVGSLILCYLWTSIRVRELLEEAEGRYERDVPDLVGRTVGDAKQLLGQSTLKLGAVDLPDDAVITMQRPAPSTSAPIGTTVRIEATTDAPTDAPVATG